MLAKQNKDGDHLSSFKYCLNTSTIRSENATVLDAIDTAANAGYTGIEPWVGELEDFLSDGGELKTVKEKADDRGVEIVNLIAFPEWAVPEEDRRQVGLEETKRCLDMAAALGCQFLAAPPRGIHDRKVDIQAVPARFAEAYDIAKPYEVSLLVEYWGGARTLGTTGEALYVACECGRPGVQILADIFHMWKGSGHHHGFEHFGPGVLGLVHVNDYPENPGQNALADADRVYPGDGLADWPRVCQDLIALGYEGYLSLELFNESYWAKGPELAAKEGFEKLRACVER